MDITEVHIGLVQNPKLKAYANLTFDDCFVIRGLKVIKGQEGIFIAMPSRKRKDGAYQDIAHPINSVTRQWLERTVLTKYQEEVNRRRGFDGEQTSDVRSPIAPNPDPLLASEARELEWDIDDPDPEDEPPRIL
jgi:stage V sporulation protein G